MDCSPPDSSGMLQARLLEWAAIFCSRGSFQPRDWTCVSWIGRRILYHWATRETRLIRGPRMLNQTPSLPYTNSIPWESYFTWQGFSFPHCKNGGNNSNASCLSHAIVVIVVYWLSCTWFFVTPWTVDHQAALSMGFPRQEYWSGLPFPSPGDTYHSLWHRAMPRWMPAIRRWRVEKSAWALGPQAKAEHPPVLTPPSPVLSDHLQRPKRNICPCWNFRWEPILFSAKHSKRSNWKAKPSHTLDTAADNLKGNISK